jgi:NTE family protein
MCIRLGRLLQPVLKRIKRARDGRRYPAFQHQFGLQRRGRGHLYRELWRYHRERRLSGSREFQSSQFVEGMTQMRRINKSVRRTGRGKTALFLGGGAPNFTLMSGALLALHEEGQAKFDIIAMAGAGAVVGLIYLAPNGLSKKRALENTVNFGISDAIYEMVPINYKAFAKSGPSAAAFNEFWFNLPAVRRAMRQHDMTEGEKFWADWLLFIGAAMCPTDLNFFSKGFCEHPRFIEDLIDFGKLRKIPPKETEIEISAFDIGKHKIVDFKNRPKPIGPEQLRAALSFPFIYPPHELNGRLYYEGAAFEALNAPADINKIEKFIVLNPLRSNLVRAPGNLWDAYIQSIIMPVVGIAEGETESHLRIRHRPIPALDVSWMYYRGALDQIITTLRATAMGLKKANRKRALLRLKRSLERKEWYSADLKIPDDYVHDALGWKRSSLDRLFRFGYRAGRKLATKLHRNRPDLSGKKLVELICD